MRAKAKGVFALTLTERRQPTPTVAVSACHHVFPFRAKAEGVMRRPQLCVAGQPGGCTAVPDQPTGVQQASAAHLAALSRVLASGRPGWALGEPWRYRLAQTMPGVCCRGASVGHRAVLPGMRIHRHPCWQHFNAPASPHRVLAPACLRTCCLFVGLYPDSGTQATAWGCSWGPMHHALVEGHARVGRVALARCPFGRLLAVWQASDLCINMFVEALTGHGARPTDASTLVVGTN